MAHTRTDWRPGHPSTTGPSTTGSFPRKREPQFSSVAPQTGVPAFAGMTLCGRWASTATSSSSRPQPPRCRTQRFPLPAACPAPAAHARPVAPSGELRAVHPHVHVCQDAPQQYPLSSPIHRIGLPLGSRIALFSPAFRRVIPPPISTNGILETQLIYIKSHRFRSCMEDC